MKQLREAIERAGEEAKCGIIFGHGDNFCAGLDLRWAAESWKTGRSERLPFQFNRNTYFEAMARGNIPFIAALHGATLGGGLETAAAAHIRVADETTFFGLPEGTRGIFIGGGGSVRVARLIGFARMQDMMLTGRVLKADEAERYGIVQYVVPKGQQMAKAKELALKICKNAPLSNFAITNSLPRLQDMSYDDGLYFERMVAEYTRSPESITRLHQFLDKTAPRVRPDRRLSGTEHSRRGTMGLRDNAIVAYAETKVMKKSDRDVWVLVGEILKSLLDKTGFERQEIDGLVMSGLTGTGGASMFWAQSTADMLGLEVGFCEQVHTGGCSAVGAVARAAAAIDAGMCEVALCMFADTHVREHNGRNDRNYRRDWTDPYGLLGPPGAFGLLQRAYDAKYGVDLRALGKLAVTQRNHAIMNENACEELRVPITIEDYLNSRMIADPIRLLDCVMLADGAAGLIVTSRSAPRKKASKSTSSRSAMPSAPTFSAARTSST